jgi:transcription elongation factor Elf1
MKNLDQYRIHSCPVCEQVDSEENLMVYLPKRRVFYCKSCNLEMKAKPMSKVWFDSV